LIHRHASTLENANRIADELKSQGFTIGYIGPSPPPYIEGEEFDVEYTISALHEKYKAPKVVVVKKVQQKLF
jgi:hypothetical protein